MCPITPPNSEALEARVGGSRPLAAPPGGNHWNVAPLPFPLHPRSWISGPFTLILSLCPSPPQPGFPTQGLEVCVTPIELLSKVRLKIRECFPSFLYLGVSSVAHGGWSGFLQCACAVWTESPPQRPGQPRDQRGKGTINCLEDSILFLRLPPRQGSNLGPPNIAS